MTSMREQSEIRELSRENRLSVDMDRECRHVDHDVSTNERGPDSVVKFERGSESAIKL